MAIRDEDSSSAELKRDARYHLAALKADKRTEAMAPAVVQVIRNLSTAGAATDEADEARQIALAVLSRADFELDELLRSLELDVLKAVAKNRKDPLYRALFPDGLSALLASRGQEQNEGVEALVAALAKRAQDLSRTYARDLTRLSKASVDAEVAWKKAETQASSVFGEEVLARLELVRQLQKNEGALTTLFPGQRRRVRSFYRPTHRRGAAPDDGTPEAAKAEG